MSGNSLSDRYGPDGNDLHQIEAEMVQQASLMSRLDFIESEIVRIEKELKARVRKLEKKDKQ